MKRILTILTVVLLILSTMVVTSAQNQPEQQNQNNASNQPFRTPSGEVVEAFRPSETFAFFPKAYSMVYVNPAGNGTFAVVSIVTYRPKTIIWKGSLGHGGCKFSTLFPTMHFIYVTKIGTGGIGTVTYKAAGNTETMSQLERFKMAFQYANRVDDEYYRTLKKWQEERRRRNEERRRRYEQSQQNRQQGNTQNNTPNQPQQ